ncbi:hypothetical protein SK128_017859 [Halocaridina rubra]|uniref:Uncharacterized protein n=1 Tax=Halocaridina rubra TaxID=373956 RepID=A0AAN8ZVH5_HALRR
MWKSVIFATVLILSLGSALGDAPRHRRGLGGVRRFDPDASCATSSDSVECRRRIEVCRNMHRSRGQRNRMYETFSACARQLGITSLPNAASVVDQPQAFRNWMRENHDDKERLFACVHRGFYNEDGTVNRAAMLQKVRTLLQGQNEPDLLREITTRVNNCPESESRREFFRCIFMGCATPQ